MKKLVISATMLAAVFGGTMAQAAILSAPVLNGSTSDIQEAGVVCGPGFHLRGLVCVRNAPVMRACPVGWHLGPAGERCVRN
jgi:hypothetical protein